MSSPLIIDPPPTACTDAEARRILRNMLTAEEFAETKFDLPEGGRWCELVAGDIRQFDPPDGLYGPVVLNLTKALGKHLHGEQSQPSSSSDDGGPAYACYELGLVTCRDPDTVRCPPVSVFVGGDAFAEMDREVTESRPVLVIELASGNQRRTGMADRVLEWHGWGVPCVWVIDSAEKSVHVAERDQEVKVRATGDTLSGDPVLPGLEFPVRELFVEPEWWTR